MGRLSADRERCGADTPANPSSVTRASAGRSTETALPDNASKRAVGVPSV